MCDYSLHLLASRPAKTGDQLTTAAFPGAITRGFAAPEKPDVAVCLLPGTELAFAEPVEYERAIWWFGKQRLSHQTARFRQINMDDTHVHHDALEFPDGKIVLVTRLRPGQRATVLQLPAPRRNHEPRSDRPTSEQGGEPVNARTRA